MSRRLTDNNNGFAVRVAELYSAQGVGPIPFEDVLDRLRPQTDDELVEVITADAAEMIVRNQPVTAFRYGPFVEGRPSANDAVIEACAGSHYELDEMSWEEAQQVARNEAAGHGRGSARRPLPRRRRRLVGGTVAVPVPIVTIIVIVAVLAMGWMGQSLSAANLRAEAEYERGQLETSKALVVISTDLARRKEALRKKEEEANRACQIAKEELAASIAVELEIVKSAMEGEHLTAEVFELLLGLEAMAAVCDPEHPTVDTYSQTRLDDAIMPVLRLMYARIGQEERDPLLAEVRQGLLRMEEAWKEEMGK